MSKRLFTPNVRLMSARRLKRITQVQLAEMTGRSGSWIAKIEQGKDFPSRSFAREIGKALDADPKELFPEVFEDK